MTGEKDYNVALGIPRTAGDQVVRRAFRELARHYPPQRGVPEKGRDFRDILEAYEALSDPMERAAYDRGLPPPLPAMASAEGAAVKNRNPHGQDAASRRFTRREGDGHVQLLEILPLGNPDAGEISLFPCMECEGQGMVEEEERLALRVPPMVREGSVLEAPLLRMGIRNLYLRVHIGID